jgi:Ca2+/Na+ antiporter
MGTTVLAAGTSIPDALSSIAVARDGLADMVGRCSLKPVFASTE